MYSKVLLSTTSPEWGSGWGGDGGTRVEQDSCRHILEAKLNIVFIALAYRFHPAHSKHTHGLGVGLGGGNVPSLLPLSPRRLEVRLIYASYVSREIVYSPLLPTHMRTLSVGKKFLPKMQSTFKKPATTSFNTSNRKGGG